MPEHGHHVYYQYGIVQTAKGISLYQLQAQHLWGPDTGTALTALDARIVTVEDDYATETWVADQEYSTDVVDSELIDLLTYLTVDTSVDSVVFSGANVYVRSGAGSTGATVNGVGNLIVGYDEDASSDKTGSHNLIVGPYHSYSSSGGVVFGYNNSVSGPSSSITGGAGGDATGYYSSITGGYGGSASGYSSSVSGGLYGIASGNYSSVTGGNSGTASGTVSSVSGGTAETATTTYSYAP